MIDERRYVGKVPQVLHLFVDPSVISRAAVQPATRNVAAAHIGLNCSDTSICAALN